MKKNEVKNKPKVEQYEPKQLETYTPEPKSKLKIGLKNTSNNSAHIQIYDIVTGKNPSWQSIIYELIGTEQIDPWNVDLGFLCQGYFEKIKEMEEHNFFISSKVLLAASLLLRKGLEVVVIAQGKKGSFTTPKEKSFHQPAFKVPVVDTAGCGDVFHGGFIYGLLRD